MSEPQLLGVNRDHMRVKFVHDIHDRVAPDMSYRELTHNALQEYARSGIQGDIAWDIEDVPGEGERWCVYDTGGGMSYAELRSFSGEIGGSGQEVATRANHGIGAKQAGLKDHPKGIEWLTLKDGCVSWLCIWISETPPYIGMPMIRHDSCHVEVCPNKMPQDIIDAGHGTAVFFYSDPTPRVNSERLVALLGQRYYAPPPGCRDINTYVTFKRYPVGRPGRSPRRATRGRWKVPYLRDAVAHHAEFSCETTLSDDTRVHVTVVRETPNELDSGCGAVSRLGLYSTSRAPVAQVGLVYQGECYMLLRSGAPGKLRTFGLVYETCRIHMFIFPPEEHYQPTDTRTTLEPSQKHLPGLTSVPFSHWADEFSKRLKTDPNLAQLRDWQRSLEVGDEADNRDLLVELLLEMSPVDRERALSRRGGRGRRDGPGRVLRPEPPPGPRPRPINDGETPERPNRPDRPRPSKPEASAEEIENGKRTRLAKFIPHTRWQFADNPADGELYNHAGVWSPCEEGFILNEAWDPFGVWCSVVMETESIDDEEVVWTLVKLTAEALVCDAFFGASTVGRDLDREDIDRVLSSPLSRQQFLRWVKRKKRQHRRRGGSNGSGRHVPSTVESEQ